MKTKIVTAYWMDVNGFPFQGSSNTRKERYLGSLISHCKNLNLPVVCYTHAKSLSEVEKIKDDYKLFNLEIKILELSDMKLHDRIDNVRGDVEDIKFDGRGPEIMWGKFDVLERELNNADFVYWLDAGLQHPGIFPWRYSKKYNTVDTQPAPNGWWTDYDVYDSSKLFNYKIFENLNVICKNKIVLLSSYGPQISYRTSYRDIIDYHLISPFPVGGMIGGNTMILKKFIEFFWLYANKILDNRFLCTEEAIMKLSRDKMNSDEIIDFMFDAFHFGEHDIFHFKMWDETLNIPKPLYVVWHDILNYKKEN